MKLYVKQPCDDMTARRADHRSEKASNSNKIGGVKRTRVLRVVLRCRWWTLPQMEDKIFKIASFTDFLPH